MENSSRDDNILRQREGDIPDSKIKKKKRKKSKSTENVRQEVDGTFESDVRKVDSVFSVSCNVEHGGKQKKKKKKRSGEDDEAVEQSQASTVAQPLIDDANVMRKKKKRKKDERIVITEECGGEKESNRIVDLPPVSTGQLEDSGNCLENTAASQETFESRYVKRKKHKKREMLSSNEATQDGEDGVSFSNVAVTLAKSTAKSHTPEINENVHQTPQKKEGIEEQIAQLGTKKKKKKKKTLSEAVDVSCTPKEHDEVENVDNTQKTKEGIEDQNAEFVTKKKKKTLSEAVDDSCILEENEEVENVDNTQKTKEGIEEQNAELVTKKKKKKKMVEVSSWNISKDSVAQSDDSVSVRKKEKKRTSSFLVADAEENDACTQDEQNSPGEYEPESAQTTGNMEETNDGVRKKKRKRKMSVTQDSVEKDQDFVDPNRTCQSALPETTDMRVKRKKKPMENESEMVTPLERPESAADAGHSLTDETVKEEEKCKDEPCHVVQESPPKKKGKLLALPLVAKGCSDEVSHDGSTCDQVTKEALNTVEHASSSETPGNQTLNETMDKKKKKKMKLTDDVLLEGNSLTKSGVLEPLKNKKKQSAVPNIISSSPMLSETSVLKSEISSSDRIMKNKHVKVKRRLHNPSEDFLTDC
ncbi:aspartoacylase isoform X1 [Micropterus salmoides]|uniref:aspartoacylase isoform X1 n=1 Tax=Micropterus salmoides TaxID=27706 RepID=UPI0018EB4BA6|nr:aspartoacylase isoform X1 [Micropterus salmoides]